MHYTFGDSYKWLMSKLNVLTNPWLFIRERQAIGQKFSFLACKKPILSVEIRYMVHDLWDSRLYINCTFEEHIVTRINNQDSNCLN